MTYFATFFSHIGAMLYQPLHSPLFKVQGQQERC